MAVLIIQHLHNWDLSPAGAVVLQWDLASLVVESPPATTIRLIAGVDAAFTADGQHCVAAAVVWDARERRVVEEQVATRMVRFPYIPGMLSFREAPAVLAALRRLRTDPDALICDGHGLAHPRRFGLACHLGVLCDLPTVGAKSRLVGEHQDPGRERGSRTELRMQTERIGTVLRTRSNVRPVFVSVGHRMDLKSAEDLVLTCAVKYRLPEPVRLADHLAARSKRERSGGSCP